MSKNSHSKAPPAHGHGFAHDFPNMLGRRGFLASLGALVAAAPATAGALTALPWETAGPFPGDGSNRANGQVVNVLTQEGVIRNDLRTSFAGVQGTAVGLELTMEIKLVDAMTGLPLIDHALYLWHCDAAGDYSIYNLEDRNYLRGVGISDEMGIVRFTSIFPGCYRGRWPHFHFEVFEDAQSAVSGKASILTAQIALPALESGDVYDSDSRYAASVRPFSRLSLESDSVFRDNGAAALEQQTMALKGSVSDGFEGTVTVPIAL